MNVGKDNVQYKHGRYAGHNNAKRNRKKYGKPEVCEMCGRKGQVWHHINEDTSDNRRENLMPLCRSCHGKHHRIIEYHERGRVDNRKRDSLGRFV